MHKVLIVCKLPPPYLGTTVWGETISKSSLNNHFDLKIFNNNIHNNLSTIGSVGLLAVMVNFKMYFRFLKSLIKFKPKVTLIPISQSTIGFLKDSVYIQLCYLLNKKVVLMLHGSNFRNWHAAQNKLIKAYTKRMIVRSNGMIVLGQNLVSLFSDWLPEEKIFVVRNGLNISAPSIRTKDQGRVLKITYLGNLQPTKGIIDVVNAAKYINDKTQIEINIYGSWRDSKTQQEGEEIQEKYSLPINFHPPIFHQDKFEMLAESDIFVFPPRMPEGHPLVLIEAMASSLPIISTDKGAIIESVINDVNGFIVPPHDPKSIADKIQYFINNPEQIKSMGKRSRGLYERKFTEDVMIHNLQKVFNVIIQN